MRIARIRLDEVVVRAKPDTINSPETDHPLHKLPMGAARGWTRQFDEVSKVMIRLELDGGVTGLGETYRGVPLGLCAEVAQSLVGLDLSALSLQDLPLPSGRVHDGFECALVDAFARAHGLPVHALLGGRVRERVRCAFWTGHRTPADAARKGREAQALGFDVIKFKCKASDPVADWCEAIADACGPALSVVLDPNERFETSAFVRGLAPRLRAAGNLAYLEDPIARWDLEAWARLRAAVDLPLCLHVSLPYVEMGQTAQDLVRAVRTGAADVFNLNGGVFAFRAMGAMADLAGVPYAHGSELDLGVLEASYVHKLAASPGATLASDVFGRLVREHDLLTAPLAIADGHVALPPGPGLGVELDPDALAHYRVAAWESAR